MCQHPKLAHHGSKPSTQQRDRSISSVSVHSSGRPKSSLSTLTDKGTPEPAIEEIIEEPSPLELEMQYEEQIRLVSGIILSELMYVTRSYAVVWKLFGQKNSEDCQS